MNPTKLVLIRPEFDLALLLLSIYPAQSRAVIKMARDWRVVSPPVG